MTEMMKEIIISLGGFGIGASILAFLIKHLMKHRLLKDLDQFKFDLKASSDKTLEEYKNQLEKQKKEHEVKYDSLHSARLPAIEKMYASVCETADRFNGFRLLWGKKLKLGKAKDYELGRLQKQFNNLEEHFNELKGNFYKTIIYFDKDTQLVIEEFLKICGTPILDLSVAIYAESDFEEIQSIIENQLEPISKVVPKLRNQIQEEFSKVLGVNNL